MTATDTTTDIRAELEAAGYWITVVPGRDGWIHTSAARPGETVHTPKGESHMYYVSGPPDKVWLHLQQWAIDKAREVEP